MKLYFDDMYEFYGETPVAFTLDLLTLPLLGETVRIHKSLFSPRYFEADYFECPEDMKELFGTGSDDDIYIEVSVDNIIHKVHKGGQAEIIIEFNFTCEFYFL